MMAAATKVRREGLCDPRAVTTAHLDAVRVPWRRVNGESMDELRRIFGGRCRRCGSKRSKAGRGRKAGPLQFAHIKPTGLCGRGRGLQHRYFDILRNPDCYELLCNLCHVAMDAAHWTRMAEEARRAEEARGDLAAAARSRLAEISAGDDAVPF